MLILAGVSLNAIVGDNGIITNAKNAQIMEAIAVLQEQVQMKTVGKAELFDKVTVANFSYSEYPKDGFLKRVSYGAGDTYVFDLQYIDRLGDGMKKSLVGGEGVNGSLNLLKNVYGINEDFTVWYIDEKGKMYGAGKIIEIPIDPNELVKASNGLKQGMGIEGDLTVGDVRGRTKLNLDGSKMTEKITDLEELSYFPNLTEITIKDLNLNNVSGLQYSPNLQKIWFDNSASLDYSGLKYCLNTTGLYLINGSVTEENIANITSQFDLMTNLNTVRIRNNSGLTKIPELQSIGNIKTLWIEENENLTNIYGLSTVKTKTSLTSLYLNENNLTDVVNTTDKNEEYDYLLPKITDENVINMSYIDGYRNLTYLDCGTGWGMYSEGLRYYEDGSKDEIRRYNRNLKYLSGEDNGKRVGVSSLKDLQEISFYYCDILDLEKLEIFQEIDEIILRKINLGFNNSLKNTQVNLIAKLLNSADQLNIPGMYLSLLSSQKEILDYHNSGLTDLSFLDGNKIVKSLNLSKNKGISDAQTVFISTLEQLTNLRLDSCSNIKDFGFLSNLPNLEFLNLSGTYVRDEDIEGLTCRKTLKMLNLTNCTLLTDVNILENFTNEVWCYQEGEFDLRNWNIAEDCDLSYFNSKNYTYLGFNKGDLTTCQEAISKCNGRFGLYLWNNESMLKKLEKCAAITYLKCSSLDSRSDNYYSGETSLNLSLCKSLGEIYFKRTSIENLNVTDCENLKKITIIDMEMGNRWNVSDLSQNKQLNYIDLTRNHLNQTDLENLIENITPVYEGSDLKSGTSELANLILSENEFNSLSPFASLSGKTSALKLDVSNNMLINLNGIEDLIQLEELDISNNPGITNITPIITLKGKSENKLQKVKIKGCSGISAEMIESLKQLGITVEND